MMLNSRAEVDILAVELVADLLVPSLMVNVPFRVDHIRREGEDVGGGAAGTVNPRLGWSMCRSPCCPCWQT